MRVEEYELMTRSDAIVSFLEGPDTTTCGLCLMSKEYVINGIWRRSLERPAIGPKAWLPRRRFWFEAPSLKRWLICMTL